MAARVHAEGIVLGLLVAGLAMHSTPACAQGSQMLAEKPDAQSGTVPNADFVKKLADPELDWPAAERTQMARAKDTRYARHDACRWQEIILAKPFAVCSYVRGDEGEKFTAGASASGYDSVYFRWEVGRYRFQFRCAQGLMSIMVEPNSPSERPTLSAREVQDRAAAVEAEIVRRGRQLLANSTMKLEPTAFGYAIRFQQTPEQVAALSRDPTNREHPIEPDAAPDDWLRFQRIRTDGYSFVFDFPKMGVGATDPSHTSTTQPGDKTWFEERKPTTAPSR